MKNESKKTYIAQSQIASYKFFCRMYSLRECELRSLNLYFAKVVNHG